MTIPGVEQLSPRQGLRILWTLRRGPAGLPEALLQARAALGDIFRLRLGRLDLVVVGHPTALREALVEKRAAFSWRVEGEPIVRLLRQGLLVQDGASHAYARRTMERSNRRRHFLPRLAALRNPIEKLTHQWVSGRTYDMLVEMRRIALVLFEAVYFSHDPTPELPKLWKPILALIKYIGPGPWLLWGASEPPPQALKVIDEHLYSLIRARKKALNPPDDLLSHLLEAYSDAGIIRDHLLTMLIAGHDTSTAALAWSLYELGCQPEWQEHLRSEIQGYFGDTCPTPEAVLELPLLDAFVREVLRLYPPIHAGNRRVVEPTDLLGYPLPPGQRVLLSYYLAHTHPAFWEEPLAFRPERWMAGEKNESFAYVPFSGGPRMCIGAPFAQVELRWVLSLLLRKYRFFLREKHVHPYMGATLEPRPSLYMQIERV
ncbi:MAG: cytochrome P450 [Bacteroidia bacterium]|nr:cytochrome P450 [Bacteroidia bacterium]GIV23279.1 MAG: cytochrome P450 [Bacteroidia bacterium]